MRTLKIYDKSFAPLTTFLDGEFSGLEHRQALGEVGDCSFVLDLSSPKVNEANLRHYNRMEVIEDGVVRWVGYIAQKTVRLSVVEVKAKGLIGLLKKRLVGSGYTASGDAGAAISSLLSTMNATEDTGITFGTEDISATVNLTFEYQSAFDVIKRIAATVGAQFELTAGRQLNFKTQVGQDLSTSVVVRYNSGQVSQANILRFEVEDDGAPITTKAYGKSSSLSSTQENAPLMAEFGLLEGFRDFRVANTQTSLDGLTASECQGPLFSPRIELTPSVADNFNVGDVIRLQLKNKLIDLDGNYQVLEKQVKAAGSEKHITIRVNSLVQDIVYNIGDINSRLSLLESKV
jgi:5-carboxymethyl-2-hydroxymuconate isomerase